MADRAAPQALAHDVFRHERLDCAGDKHTMKDRSQSAQSRRELLRGLAIGGGAMAVAATGCVDQLGEAVSELDVLDLGARGDGITDDTAAIQAALDAIADSEFGGVVHLRRGVYLITDTLVVRSRTRVVGDGIGLTVLRGKPGSYAGKTIDGTSVYATIGFVAADHSSIEHLTVDHATHSTWANGIVLVPDADYCGAACMHCTVHNCEVLGFDAHAYMIWNMRGQHTRILNNRIDGFVTTFGAEASHQEGIESFGGRNVLIQGNSIARIGNAAINIGAAVGVADSEVVGIHVTDNFIEESRHGVALGTAWDPSNGAQNLSNVQVRGNLIRAVHSDGICLTTPLPGTTLSAVQILENVIAGATTGIRLYGIPGESSHFGVVVRGNTITGATTTQDGAIAAAHMANILLDGNMLLESAGAAFWLVDLSGATVSNNNVDGCETYAVIADHCERLSVVDNRFYRYAGGGSTAGVLLTNVTRGSVRRNTFDQIGIGTDVIVSGDEMWVAENFLLHSSTADLPFTNVGTNSNSGAVTMTAGDTFVDVANTLVHGGTRFIVTQDAGSALAFRIARLPGGFRIESASAAVGDESFRWDLVQ